MKIINEQDFAEIYIEDNTAQNSKTRFTIPNVPTIPVPEVPDNAVGEIIEPPEPQNPQIHELFLEMRHLYSHVRMRGLDYDKVRASSFCRQARFMEKFEDNYDGNSEFSMYFPEYQTMSYKQLRTYFTWRSNVRRGVVTETSFSYVFIYIYELINNIGVASGQDSWDKLLFIWNAYRGYEEKLDRYMANWMKDYYILNNFEVSFDTLIEKDERLQTLYGHTDKNDFFNLYSPYSDYKFTKSIFHSDETEKTLHECFNHVVGTLIEYMQKLNKSFDDLVFRDGKGNLRRPYDKALYRQKTSLKKSKLIKISYNEVYRVDGEQMISSLNRICKESGRRIIGYILKRTEQFYRKTTGFKYKLNADSSMIDKTMLKCTLADTDGFFACIDKAILEFYKNSQKKIITVDPQSLERIRINALATQEKLLVDTDDFAFYEVPDTNRLAPAVINASEAASEAVKGEDEAVGLKHVEFDEMSKWERLAEVLDETESAALAMALRGASLSELNDFAKNRHTMAEVLFDSINEKGMEMISDNIVELSDTVTVFEEYIKDLERVVCNESK